MANEIIRPTELPPRSNPVASEVVPSDNGSSVGGVSWKDGVNAGRPMATRAEAEAGVVADKAMSPLTTKQAIDLRVNENIASSVPIRDDISDASSRPAPENSDKLIVLGEDGGTFVSSGTGDPVFVSPAGGGATAKSWWREKDVSTRLRVIRDHPADSSTLVQRKWAEYHFGNPKDGDAIFPGATRAPQGLAVSLDGRVFTRIRVSGTTHTPEELSRIAEFSGDESSTPLTSVAYSNPLMIGHQSLSAIKSGADFRLICGLRTPSGKSTSNAVKGISVINWRGSLTDQSDVTGYQLFDEYGTPAWSAPFCQGVVAASRDGKFVVILSKKRTGDSEGRIGLIYDLDEIRAVTNLMPDGITHDARSVKPISGPWKFKFPPYYHADGPQDLCIDQNFIYSYYGGTPVNTLKVVSVHDRSGNLVRSFTVDGPKATYGLGVLRGEDAAIGQPMSVEPEGIDVLGDGSLLLLDHFVTREIGGDRVEFEGRYFECVLDHTSSYEIAPSNDPAYWVETVNTSGASSWELGKVYATVASRLAIKIAHRVGEPTGHIEEVPINGYPAILPPDALYLSGNDPWIATPDGDKGIGGVSFGLYQAGLGTLKRVGAFVNRRALALFDARVDANDNRSSQIKRNSSPVVKGLELRASGSAVSGGASVTYHDADCPLMPGGLEEWTGAGWKSRTVDQDGVSEFNRSGTGFVTKFARNTVAYGAWYVSTANIRFDMLNGVDFRIYSNPGDSTGGETFQFQISVPNNAILPGRDNQQTLGMASRRWGEVFAGNSTINTSDEREKEQVTDLSVAERRVAQALKGLIKKFKWKDAVAEKGVAARWHIGPMAQAVEAAFAAEGLNAYEYGLFCYDEWDEQEEIIADDGTVEQEYRPAGSRYSLRPTELLMYILASL